MSHNEAIDSEAVNSQDDCKKRGKVTGLRLVVVAVIASLVVLSIAGVYFIVECSEHGDNPFLAEAYPESCLEIGRSGDYPSNYYVIRPKGAREPFMAYCDLDTDGGGWTLVAAIHRDAGVCLDEDAWFSEANESSLWSNNDTLNDVVSATRDNYKNEGYSTIKASNVMVRHITPGGSVEDSKRETTMEYRSRNGFLEEYGGSLRSVFAEDFPLHPLKSPEEVAGPAVEDVLDALVDAGHSGGLLPPPTPSFYRYVYDDAAPDRLTNGGSNLFDPYGMQIEAVAGSCKVDVEYGRTFRCPEMASVKSYPFFALMRTGNLTVPSSYVYKVTSHRSHANDREISGGFSEGALSDFKMSYFYRCRYSDTAPSYCDVWFTFYNRRDWNSERIPADFSSSILRSRASHSNALYGYTMIARKPPARFRDPFDVFDVMERVYDIMFQVRSRDIEAMLSALAMGGESLFRFPRPDYYRYVYDETRPDRLTNGGNDLFNPYGMEVSVKVRDRNTSQTLEYGESYLLSEDSIHVSSRRSHPFFALARTEHPNQAVGMTFAQWRPTSDQVDGSAFGGRSLRMGNYQMAALTRCSYSSTIPSLCNLIFYVYNEEEWNSEQIIFGRNVEVHFSSIREVGNQTYLLEDVAYYSMYTNALVGYTMIAREAGGRDTDFQVHEFLYNILSVIARFPSIASNCARPEDNLVVPITFSAGDEYAVVNGSRGSLLTTVAVGFMQFRSIGAGGDAFAFCPAVSIRSCQSRQFCVGGVLSDHSSVTAACSAARGSGESERPVITNDLESDGNTARHREALLIFYR